MWEIVLRYKPFVDNNSYHEKSLGFFFFFFCQEYVFFSNYCEQTLVSWRCYWIRIRYFHWGQNWHLPLLLKLSSKMLVLWNYLAKCSYFKLDFLKIEFQWKTWFTQNRIISKKTCKNLHGTWVPCKFLQVTRFWVNRVFHWNSIFKKSNFKIRVYF